MTSIKRDVDYLKCNVQITKYESCINIYTDQKLWLKKNVNNAC